eukprot:1161747-Pelagomonas_calceolata.AAC.6
MPNKPRGRQPRGCTPLTWLMQPRGCTPLTWLMQSHVDEGMHACAPAQIHAHAWLRAWIGTFQERLTPAHCTSFVRTESTDLLVQSHDHFSALSDPASTPMQQHTQHIDATIHSAHRCSDTLSTPMQRHIQHTDANVTISYAMCLEAPGNSPAVLWMQLFFCFTSQGHGAAACLNRKAMNPGALTAFQD